MGHTQSVPQIWDPETGHLREDNLTQIVLTKVIEFTLRMVDGSHPEEAAIVFDKPLIWKTDIAPKYFKEGFKKRESGAVESLAHLSRGHRPLLSLERVVEGYQLTVWTFEYLAKVLSLTDIAGRLIETRACLEQNRNVALSILGARLAVGQGQDSAALELIDEVVNAAESACRTKESLANLKAKKRKLKLMLLLKELDDRLMSELLEGSTRQATAETADILTPVIVDETLQDIQQYYPTCLISIEYLEGYTQVDDRGFRSPPQRMVLGDIAYIMADTHDVGPVFITASKGGYFINYGLTDEGELNYERHEAILYPTLINLLCDVSREFQRRLQTSESKEEEPLPYMPPTVEENEAVEEEEKREEEEQDYEEEPNEEAEPETQAEGQEDTQATEEGQEEEPESGSPEKMARDSVKLKLPGYTKEDGKDRPSEQFRKSMEEHDTPKAARFSAYTEFLKPLIKERPKKRRPSVYDWLEESSSSDEEEVEIKNTGTSENEEWSSSSWYVQKLVKVLKAGNQTATIIALCSLTDLNLNLETCNELLRENGAMEVFVSLLDVKDVRCKIGALRILQIVGDNAKSRQLLCELGCVQSLVRLLSDPNPTIKCHAAEAVSHVVRSSSSRKIIRSDDGIKKLVSLLDVPNSWSEYLKQHITELKPKLQARQTEGPHQTVIGGMKELWQKESEKARCGAMGLCACAISKRNRLMMRMNGIMPLLARQLHSDNEDILIPVVGIVKEFAREEVYLSHIRVENMLRLLVKILNTTRNPMLKRNAALALFCCAEDPQSRDLVRKHDGLAPLVQCLRNTGHADLLLAATGAIWKLSKSKENVHEFQDVGAIDLLTNLIGSVPEDVIVNIVGALSEMMKMKENRESFFSLQGVQDLLKLQVGSTNTQLLVNVNNTLAQCALHDKSMELISTQDGVRLLWSAMKHPCPKVQASACWAVCPCIIHLKDSGELVRCLVGGIGLLVSLLKSEHPEVLASACATVAAIARDEENLGILTDHEVVLLLSKLICSNNEVLMQHLAEAIAVCCYYSNNRELFGEVDAVVPLVGYLKCPNEAVERAAAHALFELSKFPNNCIDMHKQGCIKYLTDLAGSKDSALQEYCAGCISNIRRMALANYINRVGR